MPTRLDLQDALVPVWKTTNRVTVFLVEQLSPELLDAKVPGVPRKTVRMIVAHIHNSRCSWIRTLGRPHGIAVPERVDKRVATAKQLIKALESSGEAMAALLAFGCEQGGKIPPTRAYVWRNLPLDVGHVLSYFVAHEGHHRGQILMIARQLEQPLPVEVTGGVWEWTRRSKEVDA